MAVDAMLQLDKTGNEAYVLAKDAAQFGVELSHCCRLGIAEAMLATATERWKDLHEGGQKVEVVGAAGDAAGAETGEKGDEGEEQETCSGGDAAALVDAEVFETLLPRREYVTNHGVRRALVVSWRRLLEGREGWDRPFRRSWRNRESRNWAVGNCGDCVQ